MTPVHHDVFILIWFFYFSLSESMWFLAGFGCSNVEYSAQQPCKTQAVGVDIPRIHFLFSGSQAGYVARKSLRQSDEATEIE